jgi:DNA-binding beta-propeller fold protein YncE
MIAVALVGSACRTVPKPPQPEAPVFYPPPPETPRIQFLRSFSVREDVLKRKYSWVDWIVGPPQTDEVGFMKPYGIGIAKGKFYVCDSYLGTVWVVDFQNGRFEPIPGDRRMGKLRKPINLAVSEDGRKYVADIDRGQVVVFGPDDEFETAFGPAEGIEELPPADGGGGAVSESFRPAGVAIFGNRLLVTDLARMEVQVRDRETGELIRSFGSPGDFPIEAALGQPVNLDVDSQGNAVVSDTGRFRVCVYSLDGVFLSSFGQIGRLPGQFARPKGIAVDREDRIYVVDAAFENVQIFNEAHQLLMWFGGHGTDDGSLSLPAQVAIDYLNLDFFRQYVAPGYELEYLIWVTSQTGPRKVSCYGLLRPASAAPGDRE